MTTRSRFVALSGCRNFRDLGGYATADGIVMPGLLYRSDSLHRLEGGDRLQLVDLGIAAALDLRSNEEVADAGEARLGDGMTVDHVPTVDTAMSAPLTRPTTRDLAHGYEILLEEARNQHGAALRHVARATVPMVFFCNAGKDRTGLLAALVLGLLGVGDDDIVADYTLSDAAMTHVRAQMLAEDPDRFERWQMAPEDVLHARAETMERTLRSIRRRWGGFSGYAAAAGLERDDIDELRARLVHRL